MAVPVIWCKSESGSNWEVKTCVVMLVVLVCFIFILVINQYTNEHKFIYFTPHDTVLSYILLLITWNYNIKLFVQQGRFCDQAGMTSPPKTFKILFGFFSFVA